jgi:hypothetical protein
VPVIDDSDEASGVFDLAPLDSSPPAGTERLRAVRVGAAWLNNIPFFVRGVAVGDIVRFAPDADGVHCATELLGGSTSTNSRRRDAQPTNPANRTKD